VVKQTRFEAFTIPDIPLIQPGDDLGSVVLNALRRAEIDLQNHDILVIASKVVSKAEGRFVALNTVQPSQNALELAQQTGKDPRIVELVLQESKRVSRKARGVLVTEHRLGFVSANAGIDQSNIEDSANQVLLLPLDPDKSAETIRQELQWNCKCDVGVVISDTHGRPFRLGNVGVAIGVAGIPAILDSRGERDLFGRVLEISQQGLADMVASASHLLSGEGAEGLPISIIRGLQFASDEGKASDLYRPPEQDLYR